MSQRTREIRAVNVSGEPQDPAEWKSGDKQLALQVVYFLTTPDRGCPVAISITNDGAIILDYAYKGRIQPACRIYSGRVIWPKGTDLEIMMDFLGGGLSS